MKYLRKFNNAEELSAWQSSSEYAKPNVVLAEGVINYNIPGLGVFIQHINGALYDEAAWTNGGFSNDEANGVAVITAKASFVIAKTDLGKMAWSSNTYTIVNGIWNASTSEAAFADFAGYNNTQAMLATDLSGAGYSCANYTFPNGSKGYLPATGELKEANGDKSKIDSLMTKIGGTALAGYYWASTQYNSSRAWSLNWDSGYADYPEKSKTGYKVRAFTTL